MALLTRGVGAMIAQRDHATHELGPGEHAVTVLVETFEQRSRRRTWWRLMITLRAVSRWQQAGQQHGHDRGQGSDGHDRLLKNAVGRRRGARWQESTTGT
jgi:hypothetical protein